VRDQLPLSEPFVLLGESFSGPLAIRIAANPPTNLIGLALCATFARAPVPTLVPLAWLAPFAPARPPMSLLAWLLLGSWATPALKSTLAEALREVRPAVLRARAVAALRSDASALMPSVRIPALQLTPSRDRLLSRSAFQTLASGLLRCHTVVVSGPHLLLQASAERCAQEVAAFALGLNANNSFKPAQ
jgi:pimeloyl-ACP methyl ester carboxylesterase